MGHCLHACPSCSRHVRTTESACPFCGEPLGEQFAAACPRRQLSGRPLSRAALIFASATAVAGCGKTRGDPYPHATPAYAVAPPDTAPYAQPVALYAVAPVDTVAHPIDAGADGSKPGAPDASTPATPSDAGRRKPKA
jgi:hypothetical protein